MADIGSGRIPGCCSTMMFVVLFALLGLFLAGFREGVWTKYTPEDIARWHAAGAPNNSPSLLAHGLARPAKPFVVPVSAAPDVKNDSVPQAAGLVVATRLSLPAYAECWLRSR